MPFVEPMNGIRVLKTSIAVAYAFLLISAVGAQDRLIAENIVAQATALYRSGSVDVSRELLLRSLEFDPAYSESLYLLSRILGESRFRDSVRFLCQAIESDSWRTTDPARARFEYGKAMFRWGRFEEARRIAQDTVDRLPKEAGPLVLLATIHWIQARYDRCEELAAIGLRRFPGEPAFILLLAQVYRSTGRTDRARIALQNGMKVNGSALELLVGAAELAITDAECLAIVDEYVRRGGRDPRACLAAVERGASEYLDLFVRFDGLDHGEMIPRLDRALRDDEEGSASLRDVLSSYTGVRVFDADRNTYFEEQCRYEAGVPVAWSLDSDQDGVFDVVMRYDQGRPAALTIGGHESGRREYVYAEYPYLREVRFAGPNMVRVYRVVPFLVSCDVAVFSGAGEGLRDYVIYPFGYPDENEIEAFSYSLQEYGGGLVPRRSVSLLDGRQILAEEDADGDGTVDHVVYYSVGVAVSGLRDSDGDGVFEQRETYSQGELVEIRVYGDEDRYPEFMEVYAPEGGKHWDHNGDGIVDYREYRGAGDLMVREFSSRYDGVFDVRLIYRGGELVRVEREGTQR